MKACSSKESLYLKQGSEIIVFAVKAAQVPATLEVSLGQ